MSAVADYATLQLDFLYALTVAQTTGGVALGTSTHLSEAVCDALLPQKHRRHSRRACAMLKLGF